MLIIGLIALVVGFSLHSAIFLILGVLLLIIGAVTWLLAASVAAGITAAERSQTHLIRMPPGMRGRRIRSERPSQASTFRVSRIRGPVGN